jgi:hypothetical protein
MSLILNGMTAATWAFQQLGIHMGYTGCDAEVAGKTACSREDNL